MTPAEIATLKALVKVVEHSWIINTSAAVAFITAFGSILSAIGVAFWKYVLKITEREAQVIADAQQGIRDQYTPVIVTKDQALEHEKRFSRTQLEAKELKIKDEIERREKAESEMAELQREFRDQTLPLLRQVSDVITNHGAAALEFGREAVAALKENDRGNARVVEFYQAIKSLPRALEEVKELLERFEGLEE